MIGNRISRRSLLATGAAGLVGSLMLPRRPALAATPAALQLSWLHSSQFAGSYIALDRA